ncbi:carboxypeptidase-like regulatory domain-containing protein [Hymenobacter convexus]|uniref:carboxypeptidase-like regulatory domain-containing protein n=1 Tax=Hymenobacter sp. CA1UV-4 TaxID=3063782 RepID=UPI00271364A0|nr:carboxypeptidase-like regulatory domain-containing protein [Hymenobacter sp. CA1UV-4]MDO7853027.1 carboxypeptidase-like regulatory domain-containing protein [Hymenobacter sp. CA1UV-4]
MAQKTTVSGRVLELDSTKDVGVAGATILQTGTTNGASSDAEGNFTLTVPGRLDSVALTVSFIGYVRQQVWIRAGRSRNIRLAVNTRAIVCTTILYPLCELGLSSGLRYAPYGGSLRLYGTRLLHVPVSASISYQTNFRDNNALLARLTLPALYQRRRLTISESLGYQRLQAIPVSLHFRSYTGTFSIGLYRIGPVRMPTLLLGGGYARLRALQPEAAAERASFGYSFGLNHDSWLHAFHLFYSAQATRWDDYWQFQGQLTHGFGWGLQAGVAFNQLPHYSEVSLVLNRTFF